MTPVLRVLDDGTVALTVAPDPAALRALGAASAGLSVAEAARLIGRSESSVRRMCASGRLPARRVGARSWLVPRASVDAYRQHHPTPTAS